ncbi:MAG: uracil-DNA glycosylase family protein [Halodesulfurarchaeum sp.]
MEYVASRRSNPFDMNPPCVEFVPGYGVSTADFHVIGDHPGRHGGVETGIPFTRSESGRQLQSVLAEVGLLRSTGDEPVPANLYMSYLYLCVDPEDPTPADYREMELFFDAEMRAITAHVLLPVGNRAIDYVLERYTARSPSSLDENAIHATEISGGGWLVIPVADPSTWTESDREALVATLTSVLERDYRRESDLGRFFHDDSPYLVR